MKDNKKIDLLKKASAELRNAENYTKDGFLRKPIKKKYEQEFNALGIDFEEFKKKILTRIENQKNITVREFCQNRLQKKLDNISTCLPSDGYSMGGVRLAYFGNMVGSYSDRREYSKSCAYKATHGHVQYRFSIDELKNIEIIGGIITFFDKKYNHKKLQKCSFLVGTGKKQYFDLQKVEGYIVYDYHFEKKPTKEQIKEAKENFLYRKNSKKQLAKQHILQQKQIEKNRILQQKKVELFEKFTKKFYTYEDSVAAGNCEVGTLNFIRNAKLEKEKKYKGTVLLEHAKKLGVETYVNRMIIKKLDNFLNKKKWKK